MNWTTTHTAPRRRNGPEVDWQLLTTDAGRLVEASAQRTDDDDGSGVGARVELESTLIGRGNDRRRLGAAMRRVLDVIDQAGVAVTQ